MGIAVGFHVGRASQSRRAAVFAAAVVFLVCIAGTTDAAYRIGVGRADVTGPVAEVTFMGYAKVEQKGKGLHLRQFSRAFIIEDGADRIVFVSVDAAMMGQGVRKEVINRLSQRYGRTYSDRNVIISGTHTHSTPGGFLMHLLFDITSLGFVRETFDGLVDGITKSIIRAHGRMVDGKIFVTQGELLEANINRSPTAYLNNPENERQQYKYDVDKQMVQLRLVAANTNKPIGAINWFAVHPTSMNNTNKLVSSDNVGYASILLEQKMSPGSLPGRSEFVGAFASSNLGDVSPNIRGPRCQLSGQPCDGPTSTCPFRNELCVASGPGVDMFDSTKIIANRLYYKALDLWTDKEAREVTGPLKIIHQYVDMPKQNVTVENPTSKTVEHVVGCLPAMGYSFAAGTTDGPGAFNFKQGTTTSNELWNALRDFIAPPTEEDIECQGAKPILLATGQMNYPYQWQPHIVSTQLAFIGDFAIAAVPGEFTTMSGRRLRRTIKDAIVANGGSDNSDVVIAGLSNIYSDYIVTPEEYQIQRYEGASTIFGPHTLTIYLNQYKKLTEALMTDKELDAGPYPPDLSNDLISLVPPVLFDTSSWGKEIGDVVVQPQTTVKPGDTVFAKFVSGHPRNNLMHDRSFLTVERQGEDMDDWEIVATDASWETRYTWHRKYPLISASEVDIEWDVGPDVKPGVYRIHHYGYYKYILGGIFPYEGITKNFKVI